MNPLTSAIVLISTHNEISAKEQTEMLQSNIDICFVTRPCFKKYFLRSSLTVIELNKTLYTCGTENRSPYIYI